MSEPRRCPVPLHNGGQCKGALPHWWSIMCHRHWAQLTEAEQATALTTYSRELNEQARKAQR